MHCNNLFLTPLTRPLDRQITSFQFSHNLFFLISQFTIFQLTHENPMAAMPELNISPNTEGYAFPAPK
jgi:hypothetical protein